MLLLLKKPPSSAYTPQLTDWVSVLAVLLVSLGLVSQVGTINTPTAEGWGGWGKELSVGPLCVSPCRW